MLHGKNTSAPASARTNASAASACRCVSSGIDDVGTRPRLHFSRQEPRRLGTHGPCGIGGAPTAERAKENVGAQFLPRGRHRDFWYLSPVPLPLAALVALSLGASFAWSQGSSSLRATCRRSSRAFNVGSAFAVLVWAPNRGYFTAFPRDWAYLYLVPWRRFRPP